MTTTGSERYGYASDLVVLDDQLPAVVVEASELGTPGHCAHPHAHLGPGYGCAGWRYDLGYGVKDVTATETHENGRIELGGPGEPVKAT